MTYGIKDPVTLRKILWLDAFLGGTTALVGLFFFSAISHLLGLTVPFILWVSLITLIYSIVAFTLAKQQNISLGLLRTLVYANWIWTIISTGLLLVHFDNALPLGKMFLVLQILVVGALAYFEGAQIKKTLDV
jgi:hypothetical protein